MKGYKAFRKGLICKETIIMNDVELYIRRKKNV